MSVSSLSHFSLPTRTCHLLHPSSYPCSLFWFCVSVLAWFLCLVLCLCAQAAIFNVALPDCILCIHCPFHPPLSLVASITPAAPSRLARSSYIILYHDHFYTSLVSFPPSPRPASLLAIPYLRSFSLSLSLSARLYSTS
jgi:hypothetical protein